MSNGWTPLLRHCLGQNFRSIIQVICLIDVITFHFFLENDTIIPNSAQAIYDPALHIFAIISSRIHIAWVRAVAGRLKTDYHYSTALRYNTFPFPDISEAHNITL